MQATSRNDIKCFARSGITALHWRDIAISHCDKSLFCEHVINCAFDQAIAVNVNCLFFACLFLFPTGTKVSRGVPDFSHGYKSIPRGPRFFPRVQKYPAGVLCGVPSGRLPRRYAPRNDIEYFVRKGTTAVIHIQSGSETFSLQKNNILTLYARSSIII